MGNDLAIYTGQLKYKDIDFTFVFDGEELRLVPPDNKKKKIFLEWLMMPLENGGYTWNTSFCMELPYLIGNCNENGKTMIFLTRQGSRIGSSNTVLFVQISAYIIYNVNREMIDRMSFSSTEINFIHPINQAFSFTDDLESFFDKGIISVTTEDFDKTTTTVQEFKVDDKVIQVFFGITSKLSTKNWEPPLSLNSSLNFEFDPTNDYIFIYKLWKVAKSFIQFLCYRKNILLTEVELSAPSEDGKHEKFATFYTLDNPVDTEPETLKNGKYVKQQYIAGSEGKILSDIALNAMYLRHLPETYRSGRRIDAARFVMITAAFEWEFRRLYPNGVRKSEKTIKAEEIATEAIETLFTSATGKLKEIYRFLKRLVRANSLKSEINQIGKDFDSIVGVFGRQVYEYYGENIVYTEIGQRLGDQRNHFAHGDLDKDFIGRSLADLVFLEYILYAMQLKYYGVEDKNIQRSINDLFHCGFAL